MSQIPPKPPPLNPPRLPTRESVAIQSQPAEQLVVLDNENDSHRLLWISSGIIALLILLFLMLLLFYWGSRVSQTADRGVNGPAKVETNNSINQETQESEEIPDPSLDDAKNSLDDSKETENDEGDKSDPSSPSRNRLPDAQTSKDTESSDDKSQSSQSSATAEKRQGKVHYVSGGSFFGILSGGSRFVYVIDCSSSMSGKPFDRAKKELKASIADLNETKTFSVFFFSNSSFPMFYPMSDSTLLAATDSNKSKVNLWIDGFSIWGGTNPRDSLLSALTLKPDVIFLLTDGQFDESTVQEVSAANKDSVVINTIGFMDRGGETVLKKLSEQNGGTYRFVR